MSFPLPLPMRRALDLAAAAARAGEVPVGAVVTRGGRIVSEGLNGMRAGNDPTAHAEMVALRAAAQTLGTSRLDECSLWVSLEPCAMCAGAIGLARVSRVVFGAWEPKTGAVGSLWDVLRDRRLNHRPEVIGGVLEAECAALMESFFALHREAP